MKKDVGYVLLGFVPFALIGGVFYLLYRVTGSFENAFDFLFGGFFSLIVLGLVVLAAWALGHKIYHGEIDRASYKPKAGLEGVIHRQREKAKQRAAARLAAAKQDGQLSEAVDARGRVSLGR